MRSSGVQIPRGSCTRLKRHLYSAKCSWIIKDVNIPKRRKLTRHLLQCTFYYDWLPHIVLLLKTNPVGVFYAVALYWISFVPSLVHLMNTLFDSTGFFKTADNSVINIQFSLSFQRKDISFWGYHINEINWVLGEKEILSYPLVKIWYRDIIGENKIADVSSDSSSYRE